MTAAAAATTVHKCTYASSSSGSRRHALVCASAARRAPAPPAAAAAGTSLQRSPRQIHGRRHSAGAAAETAVMATMVEDQASGLPALPPLDASYEAACSFADFGNWLIPGRVMLGRYPFVEPSRCRSREQGEEQLRQLLAAGITTFVCLQAEVPEQAAMRIGGVDGFLPYRAPATLLATAMSPPPSIEEVSALRTPELDRFLPPRRRPSAWQQRRRIELDFAHCPIVDLGLPEPDRLRLLLADLEQRLQRGERLYVHCWGGRGRAGLVGACLLAQLYGLSADEALERVQRSFDTRKDGGRRSPETDEQHAFVRQFIQELNASRA